MDNAKIIIIDDDKIWLNDLREILDIYFEAQIETYSDFSKADDRITQNPSNFNLLITDIYNDATNEDFGLGITGFLNLVGNVPIIIVTAEENKEMIKIIFKKYKLIAIHPKIGFRKSDFILSISQIVKLKAKRTKGNPNNDEPDFDDETIIIS
jgi:DNA-binding NtrC family response regulator